MRPLVASHCTLEPLVVAHSRELFSVLSDPAIYEFENEPPPSESWLAERYAKLERRASADGSQVWLNWALRLPSSELAGYVQATLLRSGAALVAYELASRHWRKGIASSAVSAMLAERRHLSSHRPPRQTRDGRRALDNSPALKRWVHGSNKPFQSRRDERSVYY